MPFKKGVRGDLCIYCFYSTELKKKKSIESKQVKNTVIKTNRKEDGFTKRKSWLHQVQILLGQHSGLL